MKINKLLLLGVLIATGCGSKTSSPAANSSKASEAPTVTSSVSSSEDITFGGNSSSEAQTSSQAPISSEAPKPAGDNMVDMSKVLNLQCSKGTAYGQSYCTGDNGGYYGSWYVDWEGWWVEYTQVGDYGVSVKSPEGCDYSGADFWYVQLNIPSDKWDGEKMYKFSFDVKSNLAPAGAQAPVQTPQIDVSFLKSEDTQNPTIKVGSFAASNPTTTHYEWTFKTSTGTIQSSNNYLSISLGGRGALDFTFTNLYVGLV